MSRRVAILSLLLCCGLLVTDDLSAQPTVPAVRRVAADTGQRIHAHTIWPGHGILLLTAQRPLDTPEGESVETEDGAREQDEEAYADLPRHLLLLEGLPAAPRLRELRRDLPAAARSLAWVAGELWLGEPGKLHRLAPVAATDELGAPRLLLADPALDLASAIAQGWLDDSNAELSVADSGELRRYRRSGERLELIETRPLPLRIERRGGSLLLSTPPVTLLASGLVAVGPEAAGDRRLRVLLLPRDEAEIDTWGQLPAAEKVVSSQVVELSGRPALVAVVRSADRLGLFEKARVRVIGLAADRSRSGRRPMLSIDTASRPWQAVETLLVDGNGDGHLDLAVLHEEGMSGEALLIDLYLGDGRGGLRPSQRISGRVELEDSAWHYGDDLDGDGLPDAILRTRERLMVIRGDTSRGGLLARNPWLDLAVTASGLEPTTTVYVTGGPETGAGYTYVRGRSRPHTVDVDGDGRLEILLVTQSETGAESVLWVSPWDG